MPAPSGYSLTQIILHWTVAFLIVSAYVTSDRMGRALRTRLETGGSGFDGNTSHVWIGGLVFALILIRIVVRLASGAPGPTGETPPVMAFAAKLGHLLLYSLMVAVPVLGAAAWYGGVEIAGEVHETAGNALMALALAHAVAGIAHEAWLGDGTLARMAYPKR